MTLKLKHLCLKFLSNFTLSTERATQQFEGLCCTTTTLEQSSFQIVNICVTTIDSSNNAATAAKSNTFERRQICQSAHSKYFAKFFCLGRRLKILGQQKLLDFFEVGCELNLKLIRWLVCLQVQ